MDRQHVGTVATPELILVPEAELPSTVLASDKASLSETARPAPDETKGRTGELCGAVDGIVYSEYPQPPQRVPKRPKAAPKIQLMSSYNDLFNRTYDDENYFIYDKYVMLPPFNKRAYVTNATFTIQDLYKYAWLLAQSEERWYTMPTTSELAEMRRDGIKELPPVEEPMPTGVDTPCILAGEVLTLTDDIEECVDKQIWGNCRVLHPEVPVTPSAATSPASSTSASCSEQKEKPLLARDKWGCELCYSKRLDLASQFGWVYLSVVRAEVQGARSPQGNGMGMYMLKKHGSREAAAATAFCDAGVRGWSTVFSCAMRADVQILGWKGEMERTASIEGLLVSKDGTVAVCF